MSLTKRYLSDLQDLADHGDEQAIETLTAAGLWQSEEDYLREEAEFFNSLESDNAFTEPDGEIISQSEFGDEELPW